MTGIKLKLLTNIDQHLFIEKGLRGGISVITLREGEANYEYMPSVDEDKDIKLFSY